MHSGKRTALLIAGGLGAAHAYRTLRPSAVGPSARSEPGLDSRGRRDPLATYVHDHLAGARSAMDILRRLGRDHAGESLAAFAGELLADIESDREALQEVADHLGNRRSRFKEAASWLASQATRAKLGRSLASDFGTFQALEILALGVQGKRALWDALARVAPGEPRLSGFDFKRLAWRAEKQHAGIERRRLEMAGALASRGPESAVA